MYGLHIDCLHWGMVSPLRYTVFIGYGLRIEVIYYIDVPQWGKHTPIKTVYLNGETIPQ